MLNLILEVIVVWIALSGVVAVLWMVIMAVAGHGD